MWAKNQINVLFLYMNYVYYIFSHNLYIINDKLQTIDAFLIFHSHIPFSYSIRRKVPENLSSGTFFIYIIFYEEYNLSASYGCAYHVDAVLVLSR